MGNRSYRSNRRACVAIIIAAIALLFYDAAVAAVNSRLVFISNQHNVPSPGRGTLVLDMEAISDAGVVEIDMFENAFALSAEFLSLNPVLSFSDEYFFFEVGSMPAHIYTTDATFTNGTGAVSFSTVFFASFPFPGNSRKTIGTSYVKIVRIAVEYDLSTAMGSISWLSGFTVTDETGADITGVQEPIPPLLNDISLPVELSSFNAVLQGNKAVLTWETQSEVNNQGFEVYRSLAEEGAYVMIATYENLPSLAGAGNSNTLRAYTYEDVLPNNSQTYWYQIADVDYQGVRTFHGPVAAESQNQVAETYVLHANYPNPFNPETNIIFEIPAGAGGGKAELIVYSSLGTEVRTLVSGSVAEGSHTVQWDGRNDTGQLMASGVYFYRFQSGTFSQTRKMMLVR